MEPMRQEAPFPDALAWLVERTQYKEGWKFVLGDVDRGQGSSGLTLDIQRWGPDSYHPERSIRVHHYMLVPPAAYDARSWRSWLFDQILLVEKHEAMEFFQIEDSPGSEHAVRPYAPLHGPGNDPYLVAEVASDTDRRTSFRGEMNPGTP